MPAFEVVTIGSATVDVFLKSDQFHLVEKGNDVVLCERYNQKIEVEQAEMTSGGGATNVAVGLARLGYVVACIAKTGKDASRELILSDLKSNGVDSMFLVADVQEQTGVSVILIAPDGGRTVLVHRGAAAHLGAQHIPWETLTTEWIHLSSVGNAESVSAVFRYVQKMKTGLSWNPGSWEISQVQQGVLQPEWSVVKILFVNREEMAQLSGLPLGDDSVWKGEWEFSGPEIIIVTDGKRGGVCKTNDGRVLWFESVAVSVVQETGAGDAFASGFLAGYLGEQDLERCLELGRQNAASVVQQMGAKAGLLRLPSSTPLASTLA